MIPPADRQMAWIEEVLAFGIRRPGSPEDQAFDKVHVDSLEPVGRATVRIVESLRGRTAADLRVLRAV